MTGLLTVVTGPPCSGKTTYVAEHRGPDSVVLDLDALAHALGYPEPHLDWSDHHPAAEVARGVRYQLVGQILAGQLVAEIWVIDSAPGDRLRRAYDRVGAAWVHLDPGQRVCLDRAAERGPQAVEHVRRWYAAGSAQLSQSSAAALDIFG